MERGIPALAFAAMLAMVCVSCATVPSAGKRVAVPSDYLGIAHAGYSNSDAEYDLLRMLGARFSRIDFSWDIIEPRPGSFDFSRYDAIVETTGKNKIGLLAILDYDVPWIHGDDRSRKYIPPSRMGDWLNYVEKVVERYRGKVSAYEIWNEPNWFFWKGNAEEFAELTRETAALIRKIDPLATIVAGAFFRDPRGLAGIMMKKGAFSEVDAISFHPYSPTVELAADLSTRFMEDLRAMGYSGKFWITEAGFTTRGIYPNSVSDEEYPSSLVKTVTLLAISGSEKLVWYTLTDRYMADEKPRGLNIISVSEAYFGLAYPDYSPKNVAYAYSAIARVIQGSTYDPASVGNLSNAEGVRVFPFLMKDGSLGLILWANSNTWVEFSVFMSGTIPWIDRAGEERFSGRTMLLSRKPTILISDIGSGSPAFPLFSIRKVSD